MECPTRTPAPANTRRARLAVGGETGPSLGVAAPRRRDVLGGGSGRLLQRLRHRRRWNRPPRRRLSCGRRRDLAAPTAFESLAAAKWRSLRCRWAPPHRGRAGSWFAVVRGSGTSIASALAGAGRGATCGGCGACLSRWSYRTPGNSNANGAWGRVMSGKYNRKGLRDRRMCRFRGSNPQIITFTDRAPQTQPPEVAARQPAQTPTCPPRKNPLRPRRSSAHRPRSDLKSIAANGQVAVAAAKSRRR